MTNSLHSLLITHESQSQSSYKLTLYPFSAPPYCGPHSVAPQGWNYPSVPVTGPTSAVVSSHSLPVHTVDLSAHPPYHLPPEGFKIPTGHLQLGSDSGSDGDASMTSATTIEAGSNMNIMDSNRNIT